MERLVERPNDDGGPLFPAPHEEMTAKKGVRRGARLLAAGLLALLMVGARLPVIGVGDAHAAGYWTSGNCFYAPYATGSGYFKVGCLQNYNGTRYFLGLPPVYGSYPVWLGMNYQTGWWFVWEGVWNRIDNWIVSQSIVSGGNATQDLQRAMKYNNCLTARVWYGTNCALQ